MTNARGFAAEYILPRSGVVALLALATIGLAPSQRAQATFPGSPGAIAFSRFGDIYTVRPDGSHLTRLTHLSKYDLDDPVYSPDGQTIAFQSTFSPGSDDLSHIYLMRSNGSHIRELAHTYEAVDPAFSPDGRWIAYSTSDGIWVERITGTGPRRIAVPGQASDVVFSPDGRSLVFTLYLKSWDCGTIYRVLLNGSRLTRLVPCTHGAMGAGANTSGVAYNDSASFSPNGQTLIFHQEGRAYDPSSGQPWPMSYDRLVVMNADGSNIHALQVGDTCYHPAYSPDGNETVFTGYLPGGNGLWVMSSSGQNLRLILRNPDTDVENSNPSWQPLPPA